MLKQEIKTVSETFFTKEVRYEPELYKGFKAFRAEEIDSLTVSEGGYVFEANEKSMDRMDRVVDIANWEFNRAVSMGLDPANAYSQIYQQTFLPWKMTDNTINIIPVEMICNAQKKALYNLANVWVKYG